MKKLFVFLILASFITSCYYIDSVQYKLKNVSDYPINVHIQDSIYCVNSKETWIYEFESQKLHKSEVDPEKYFPVFDSITTLYPNSLIFCKDYQSLDNWFYNYDKLGTYTHTYTLIINNTDICSKY